MDDSVPFGSRTYGLLVVVLLVARGMDFLSTWVATPNLVLEGNPIAKKLGWKFGIPLNLALCFTFARWPVPAMVVSTTSVLVAARNLQQAWLMRSMGEFSYRDWHLERLRETGITLYLFCLFGQTILTAGVGAVLIYFTSEVPSVVPVSIGMGIIAYALAVIFFSLLGIWRLRRSDLRNLRFARAQARIENQFLSPPGRDSMAPNRGVASGSLKEP